MIKKFLLTVLVFISNFSEEIIYFLLNKCKTTEKEYAEIQRVVNAFREVVIRIEQIQGVKND